MLYGFGIMVGIVAIIATIFLLFLPNKKNYLIISILGIFLSIGLITITTIPRGTVGVSIRFGAVTGEYREQGLQIKSPLIQYKLINIQTQKYETAATAASMDLQDVETTIALNYHLSGAGAPAMYRTLGEDYIEKLASPAIQETVKKITATFEAEDLILKRSTVKGLIQEDLTVRLGERGIIVETLSITNFKFSPVFTQAIEAKVAAQQAVFEAQNKLERIAVEAKQKEAQALGEANALIKIAEGQARSITIVTEAQVQANKDIADSLNADVLQYIFLDRLGDNIQVVIIPQGQDFTLPALVMD